MKRPLKKSGRASPIGSLPDLATGLDVTAYLSPRDYLAALYQAKKAQGGGDYSYLKFADELGFSATNVIRLMIIGERPITPKAGEKMATALSLSGDQRRYWTTLLKYGHERLPSERDRLFTLLMSYRSREAPRALAPLQMEYFSEWYHSVIREMAGLDGFDGTAEWLQERLGFPLRLDEVRKSLELLKRLKYVLLDANTGRWGKSADTVATAGEVDSLAIVRYHQKMLDVARESITVLDEDRRDVRAVTVSIPAAMIPLLKGKLEALVLEVAALERECGAVAADEVVQVNVQMFPFTRPAAGRLKR